ncbi:exported hypothetical protein [Candidatus Sulfopaludibacter sp. SbA4]|nr:exported hypothetical protein [Candidatus Sulfopaludibacter sp. SbA4]
MKTALLITVVCGAVASQSVPSAAFAFNFARPGASKGILGRSIQMQDELVISSEHNFKYCQPK